MCFVQISILFLQPTRPFFIFVVVSCCFFLRAAKQKNNLQRQKKEFNFKQSNYFIVRETDDATTA